MGTLERIESIKLLNPREKSARGERAGNRLVVLRALGGSSEKGRPGRCS